MDMFKRIQQLLEGDQYYNIEALDTAGFKQMCDAYYIAAQKWRSEQGEGPVGEYPIPLIVFLYSFNIPTYTNLKIRPKEIVYPPTPGQNKTVGLLMNSFIFNTFCSPKGLQSGYVCDPRVRIHYKDGTVVESTIPIKPSDKVEGFMGTFELQTALENSYGLSFELNMKFIPEQPKPFDPSAEF